ncbi:hypothetical protein AC062_1499 [Pasteurellaceae bacterium NI1060]|nr:hypothetical protein AC062_1499 [Pasteurellaceae bacterium NI1060]
MGKYKNKSSPIFPPSGEKFPPLYFPMTKKGGKWESGGKIKDYK